MRKAIKLLNIENLIGSNFDDTLEGEYRQRTSLVAVWATTPCPSPMPPRELDGAGVTVNPRPDLGAEHDHGGG